MGAKKLMTYDVKETFKQYEGIAKAMLDAWVVVDENGKVIKSNALFQQVTGMKGKAIIRSASFDACLSLNLQGQSYSILDLLKTNIPTRIDEISGNSIAFESLILVLGYYPFLNDAGNPYGAFILIRDVTAEAGLQGKFTEKSKQSITDKLTGLYNRAHFESVLPRLIQNAQQAEPGAVDSELSFIIFDIDFFKKVNDQYGHQAGDMILSEVATIMRKSFRKIDIVCRYGGEEFLVILPGCNLHSAANLAEELRIRVEKQDYSWSGVDFRITISAGVAQIDPKKETMEATFGRADQGLYEAKKTGRNKVITSSQDGKLETYSK